LLTYHFRSANVFKVFHPIFSKQSHVLWVLLFLFWFYVHYFSSHFFKMVVGDDDLYQCGIKSLTTISACTTLLKLHYFS